MQNPSRHIELDIDIGADAKDWSAVQATEKLKPVETELRKIEEMVAEIVSEMDYLRTREQKLRDTNESTNTRVKWFAFSTMGMLVALGAWQIIYLRAYFRQVVPTRTILCRESANFCADQSTLFRFTNQKSPDFSVGSFLWSGNPWFFIGRRVKYRYIMTNEHTGQNCQGVS